MRIVLILIMCYLSSTLWGQNNTATFIKNSCLKLVENSRMKYTTDMKMADGKLITATGQMSFLGNNFYDSSSAHFVFLNNKWYIGADHEDKTIKVFSIDAWKKEYGEDANLNLFDFLLDDDNNLLQKAIFKTENLANDFYVVHITFSQKDSYIKGLHFKYKKGSNLPLEYYGEVTYPTEYTEKLDEKSHSYIEVPINFVVLNFKVFDIEKANQSLFDHSRLIKEDGNTAHILVYKKYQTIIKKSKK